MTRNLRLLVPMSLLGSSIAAQQPSVGAEPVRPSPITQNELVRRLETSLDSLARVGQFSGVAVVAKNGVPVFQRAYGMADRERGVVNNPETAFNLGSINKVFTQIAIMQLRAAGKLDLDSTLFSYWPDYPKREVARRITIRQLMRHTSGIGGNIFAFCRSAAGIRARDAERVLECGICRARAPDRAAVGGGLLHVRARSCLQAGGDDSHWIVRGGFSAAEHCDRIHPWL